MEETLTSFKKDNVVEAFTNTGSLDRESSSNTVELYDIMPKYTRAGKEKALVTDPSQSRRFYKIRYQKVEYLIQIDAAKLPNKIGRFEFHFPSTSEEIIEDVIRYLSVSQDISFLRENFGCRCSIYMIKSELKKRGKTRSTAEVKKSIEILGNAQLTLYIFTDPSKDQKTQLFTGSFFSESTLMSFNDWQGSRRKNNDQSYTARIKFHNMVTDRILEGKFRLLQYDISMTYKHPMARWLHKRISHCHKGADSSTPYTIHLSTIYNDGNWHWSKRLRANKKNFLDALEEMEQLDQVQNPRESHIKKIYDEQGIHIDYACKIYLTKKFIKHIIIANSVEKENIELLSATETHLSEQEQLLISNGVSLKVAQELSIDYDPQTITKAIDYSLNARAQSTNHKFSLGAYIFKCLKEGWHQQPEQLLIQANADDIAINEKILSKLSEPLQQKVQELWSNWGKGTRKTFNKHGLRSPHIVSRLGLD